MDTGEFLAVDVSDTAQIISRKEQDERIRELEDGVRQMVERVHNWFHLPHNPSHKGERKSWTKCSATTCRLAQKLLRLPPFN